MVEAKRGEIDHADAPPRPGTRQAIIAFMEQFLGRPIEDERDYYKTWLGFLESPELPKGLIDAGLSPERSAQIEADFNRMMDAPAIPHDRSVSYLAERWISAWYRRRWRRDKWHPTKRIIAVSAWDTLRRGAGRFRRPD